MLQTGKVKKKVKLSLCLTNYALHHEGVWGSGCIAPHFLDLGSTHWIGGWVDLIATLDDVEKRKILTLAGLKLQPLGYPACSQSQYQLLYSGS
jgi:hypothetical protein